MPPVMGAGAYMMLEIVDPPVTYLEIIRAALIPALLYYLSLILIVHFHARRMSIATEGAPVDTAQAAAETGEAAQRVDRGGNRLRLRPRQSHPVPAPRLHGVFAP